MTLRDEKGTQVSLLDTRTCVFSNFDYVDAECYSHHAMRRILSLARKNGYQSMFVELLDGSASAIISGDNDDLSKRSPTYSSSEVRRYSFFKNRKEETPRSSDFIGYAILKIDRVEGRFCPHVYEAVLLPSRRSSDNNFIHCARLYSCETPAGRFDVSGVLYAQQNDLTFVCAHVALRTALSFLLPNGDISYQEMNKIVGVDHRSRKVGGGLGGLDISEIVSIVGSLGVDSERFVHEPSQNLLLPVDYQRHLYGSIESGFPALLGFELADPSGAPAARHIIPVLGHTFNEDAWVPEAQRGYFGSGLSYYPSDSWLSSFVVHDDNFGPYYCIPRNFLQKDNFRLILSLKNIKTKSMFVSVEALAFGYVQSICQCFQAPPMGWMGRFFVYAKAGSLVVRTSLISRERYLDHIRSIRDSAGVPIEDSIVNELKTLLSDHFWMAEVSAPELFPVTRRKFGEFLISMDSSGGLLAARLPGLFVFPEPGNVFRPQSSLCKSHTPIL